MSAHSRPVAPHSLIVYDVPMTYYKPVSKGVNSLPQPGDPGAFGSVRKHDIHTGVDIYCDPDARVFAIERGVVVAVEKFTGAHADSPWWNDTWAILIRGVDDRVVCYGELKPRAWIQKGYHVFHGETIGEIIPVLKKDKGVTPTTMLHFELYKPGTTKSVWWHHGDAQPESLLDPTELLGKIYGQ